MKNKNFIALLGISLILFLVLIFLIVGFFKAPKKVKLEKLDGGSITLTYTDTINGIQLLQAEPVSDSTGMKFDSADKFFDFSFNTSMKESDKINYEISIKKDTNESSTLDENIRVYLEKQSGNKYESVFGPDTFTPLSNKTKLGTKKGYMVIYSRERMVSGTENYRLRVWLSDRAIVDKKALQKITMKVYVTGKAS